jgi:hypothetical protein
MRIASRALSQMQAGYEKERSSTALQLAHRQRGSEVPLHFVSVCAASFEQKRVHLAAAC